MFHQISGYLIVLLPTSNTTTGQPIETEDLQDILTEDGNEIYTEN
jgi:hypothetical protein